MSHVPHAPIHGQTNGHATSHAPRNPPGRRSGAAPTTTDPAGLAAWAATLLPVVGDLRLLAEDATAVPTQRVHSRLYLRRRLLKSLRELEASLHATETPPG